MSSTPKHLELYRVFGWQPPAFAHVALLQDSTRQKLSKRDLATSLETMKNDGTLPEALLNFVALLGWSNSSGSDFMTKQELIDNVSTSTSVRSLPDVFQFSLKFTKGNGVINFPKLDHLSVLHFRRHLEGSGKEFENIVDQFLKLVEPSTGSSTK